MHASPANNSIDNIELGICGTSLVFPKQSVLRNLQQSLLATEGLHIRTAKSHRRNKYRNEQTDGPVPLSAAAVNSNTCMQDNTAQTEQCVTWLIFTSSKQQACNTAQILRI